MYSTRADRSAIEVAPSRNSIPLPGTDDVRLTRASLEHVLEPLVLVLRVAELLPRLAELDGDLLPAPVGDLPALGDHRGLEQQAAEGALLVRDLVLEPFELGLRGLELLLRARLGPRDLDERGRDRERHGHAEGATEHAAGAEERMGHGEGPFLPNALIGCQPCPLAKPVAITLGHARIGLERGPTTPCPAGRANGRSAPAGSRSCPRRSRAPSRPGRSARPANSSMKP